MVVSAKRARPDTMLSASQQVIERLSEIRAEPSGFDLLVVDGAATIGHRLFGLGNQKRLLRLTGTAWLQVDESLGVPSHKWK